MYVVKIYISKIYPLKNILRKSVQLKALCLLNPEWSDNHYNQICSKMLFDAIIIDPACSPITVDLPALDRLDQLEEPHLKDLKTAMSASKQLPHKSVIFMAL